MAQRLKVREFGTSIGGFNGATGNYITIGNVLNFLAGDNFSVFAWINPDRGIIGGTKAIASKKNNGGSSSGAAGWSLCSLGSGNPWNFVRFLAFDGTTSKDITGTIPLKNGWNFVGVTVNRAGNITLYINGVADTAAANGALGDLTNTEVLRFAADGAGNNKYSGSLDSIRIFSKELSAQEVANLYFIGALPAPGNLLGEWLFNEGAGTSALDTSPSGNNGAFTGTPVYSLGSPMHERLRVREFGTSLEARSANNSKVVFTDAETLHPANAITVAIWLKILTAQSQDVFSRAASVSDRVPLLNTVGTIRFALTLSGVNLNFTSTRILEVGRWYHVVCTYDSATGAGIIYVNGQVFATGTGTGTITNTGNWQLNTLNGSTYGDMRYDSLKMWSAAMAAGDVQELYLKGRTPHPGFVLDCNFNEGSGSVANDSSGYGNNGAITGATYSTDVVVKERTKITDATPRVRVRDFGTSLFAKSAGSVKTTLTTAFKVGALNAAGLTVSFWFKFDVATGQTLIRFNSQDDTLDNLRIAIEATRKLFIFATDTGGTGALVVKPTTLTPNNEWVNIAFTFIYDGANGNAEIFLNGISTGTGSRSAYAQRDSGNFKVAFSSTANESFDSVRVFNRILSAAEILALYQNGRVPNDALTSMQLEWLFNEGSGTVANDNTQYGNTGTISSAAYSTDVPGTLRQAS